MNVYGYSARKVASISCLLYSKGCCSIQNVHRGYNITQEYTKSMTYTLKKFNPQRSALVKKEPHWCRVQFITCRFIIIHLQGWKLGGDGGGGVACHLLHVTHAQCIPITINSSKFSAWAGSFQAAVAPIAVDHGSATDCVPTQRKASIPVSNV